jgi:hypothetical protein
MDWSRTLQQHLDHGRLGASIPSIIAHRLHQEGALPGSVEPCLLVEDQVAIVLVHNTAILRKNRRIEHHLDAA